MKDIKPETTAIYLTPQEAFLFVEFQKQYALIKALESIGAFRVRSGSVTVHFDSNGLIGSLDKVEHYRP
jgi:hypothetical protein